MVSLENALLKSGGEKGKIGGATMPFTIHDMVRALLCLHLSGGARAALVDEDPAGASNICGCLYLSCQAYAHVASSAKKNTHTPLEDARII